MEAPVNIFRELGKANNRLASILAKDQKLARLLVYMDDDPLSLDHPDIDWLADGSYKNYVTDLPTIRDEDVKQGTVSIVNPYSFVNFNDEFSNTQVQFFIYLPIDMWHIKEEMNRNLYIMERIVDICQGQRITGIGTLQYSGFSADSIDKVLARYTVSFSVVNINGRTESSPLVTR